jgi:hypothetical protein
MRPCHLRRTCCVARVTLPMSYPPCHPSHTAHVAPTVSPVSRAALVTCCALLVLLVSPVSCAACVTCARATCVALPVPPMLCRSCRTCCTPPWCATVRVKKKAKKKKKEDKRCNVLSLWQRRRRHVEGGDVRKEGGRVLLWRNYCKGKKGRSDRTTVGAEKHTFATLSRLNGSGDCGSRASSVSSRHEREHDRQGGEHSAACLDST